MPRREHDCAGTCGKLVVTNPKQMLSLDDVEKLVLIRVYVEGVSSGSTSSMIANAPAVVSVVALTRKTAPANDRRSPAVASRW